jgi:hypothetical protein
MVSIFLAAFFFLLGFLFQSEDGDGSIGDVKNN